MPEGINADEIEAEFKNRVLKVTLPKKPEAIKAEKKIEVKRPIAQQIATASMPHR